MFLLLDDLLSVYRSLYHRITPRGGFDVYVWICYQLFNKLETFYTGMMADSVTADRQDSVGTVASFPRRGAHDLNLGQGLLYYLE